MNRPWTGQVSIREEEATALLSAQFPELSPIRAVFLAEGWDNAVFKVNESLIFRFPRRSVALDCMEAENRVLPWIGPLMNLPVPRPSHFGTPSEQFPYPFTGYAMLPGRSVHTAPLDFVQRDRLAMPLAQFLKALHHIPVDQASGMGAQPDRLGRMDLERQIPKFENNVQEAVRQGLWDNPSELLRAAQGLPRAENPASGSSETGLLLHSRSSSGTPSSGLRPAAYPRAPVALVHGDLNFRNILVNAAGEVCGILDWGDVHIGHPAIDLSIAHSLLPPKSRQSFLQTYGDPGETTWNLARFRAIYVNLYLLLYAHDIGDALQAQEARTALEFALS